MENFDWYYEKLTENDEIKIIRGPYINDTDGSITGQIVMNVKAWMDENPAERIRLGWIKHIIHDTKDIEYNKQTQFLTTSTNQIDDNTIEDVYHIVDKSEEQLAFEEMLRVATIYDGTLNYM